VSVAVDGRWTPVCERPNLVHAVAEKQGNKDRTEALIGVFLEAKCPEDCEYYEQRVGGNKELAEQASLIMATHRHSGEQIVLGV